MNSESGKKRWPNWANSSFEISKLERTLNRRLKKFNKKIKSSMIKLESSRKLDMQVKIRVNMTPQTLRNASKRSRDY